MMKKFFKFIGICLIVTMIIGTLYWWGCIMSNPWNAETIGDIPAPHGYTRVEASSGSYAEYLRSLPLRKRGTKVNLYTGGEANYQFLSAGVINQDILSNSEQCADVTMRLRAEYLWQKGRYSEISFRNVNGKQMNYTGGSSRKAFESYMRNVYEWCSTYSVYHETTPRAILNVQPGDVLVYPARSGMKYGHALIVVDVAKKGSKVAIMCAEGNTPARDKHIVRNLNPLDNPWFFFDGSERNLRVSVFHFKKDELRHY